ncbi:hypothetical protein HPP92_009012 [Vanilla planifolia]|uniref:Inositol-tetrakisphosphate 1-kinase n=1 Tax=Vanilla planifolia TaxID=51239 RepID=A0A835R738_VANPL|nr:hypothetical protein HPP92_009012 [Vanilla planifolia]
MEDSTIYQSPIVSGDLRALQHRETSVADPTLSPSLPSHSQRRYRIGFALPPKKQRSFLRPSLVSLSGNRGLDVLLIDPALPITAQGHFDCILHKLYGEPWTSNLLSFSSHYPSVPIIDLPDAVSRLQNRISMLSFASDLRLSSSFATVSVPRQIFVHEPTSYPAADLPFPLIAKPIAAADSAEAHDLTLVFRPHALLRLKPPFILQEFVNHGGVVFKLYVAGDHVRLVKRKSLPDVVSDDNSEKFADGWLQFSRLSNVTSVNSSDEAARLQSAEMPPMSFVMEIAREMKKSIGLNLFNIDLIKDERFSNHYLMIDINYFPGYEKLESYETMFTDFLLNIVSEDPVENHAGVCPGDEEKVQLSYLDMRSG